MFLEIQSVHVFELNFHVQQKEKLLVKIRRETKSVIFIFVAETRQSKWSNTEISVLISAEDEHVWIMKSPYAICSRLILQEERVDEMECKSFIKCSDSNLLSVSGELVLGERRYSEATTQTAGDDWNLLWSSTTCGNVAVSVKLSAKCREKRKGTERRAQSVIRLCSRK